MTLRRTAAVLLAAFIGATAAVNAGEVARGELAIIGLGLEVSREPVLAATGVPSSLQTIFGGKSGDEAIAPPGMAVLGELTGPSISEPITLTTLPGKAFVIPALHAEGEYTLQNIRLVGASGEFLQQAVPSFATIQVSNVLETRTRVRQLTPEELRERGILLDPTNYDMYEFTFIFALDDGTTVEIPYEVMIDKWNRQITPVKSGTQSPPPVPENGRRLRLSAPPPVIFDIGPSGELPEEKEIVKERPQPPSIPAALVIPTGFGVLHQFFAVILEVSNAASDATVRLDSVTAQLSAPSSMRVAKVTPPVSLSQAVPIHDEETGATFLVAGGRGMAEWSLEALRAGTHSIDIDIRATYQKPGQADYPMAGRATSAIVVSDPRFQITFTHPDVVRKDEPYTTYAYVTNHSAQSQHVLLDTTYIPLCNSGGSVENICRTEGTGITELDLEPGEMRPVPYKLTARITGNVFAGAGGANDASIGVSVQLTMGVSESGIPLSPATLLLPHYVRYVSQELVDANLQLFGLGYSLAIAPLNKHTARHPRVIQSDVFTRAQEIALAGQRIFVSRASADIDDPIEDRGPIANLALDLLDNPERVDQLARIPMLSEWDELRRREDSGRRAGAAMARELERVFALPPAGFVDEFAAATAHRTPFLLAYAHGPPVAGNDRPYALSASGVISTATLDVPAEAAGGWVRDLPLGELTRLNLGGETGELARVGRWSETLRIRVVPAAPSFMLHLLYPDSQDGVTLRAELAISGAIPGEPVYFDLERGSRSIVVKGGTAVPQIETVSLPPLRVIAAAQDLHLDTSGHVVTLLFNRPVDVPTAQQWRDRLTLTISVPKASYVATRRNLPGDPLTGLQIPAAIPQWDARLVNVTFDKVLTTNASYTIDIEGVHDRLNVADVLNQNAIVPRVDNDRPGAILTGRVLLPDNTPVSSAAVTLLLKAAPHVSRMAPLEMLGQTDIVGSDGRFMFEYVPRDIDRGMLGIYDLHAELPDGRTTMLSGAVRRPGEVHEVNLVFIGRGRVHGHVRYDDGSPLAGIAVEASSPLHPDSFLAVTDSAGYYEMEVSVGPLTFYARDSAGRVVYATNQLRTAGEVITQDLELRREAPTGHGTVILTVRRVDNNQPIAGAETLVAQNLHAFGGGLTDANGRVTVRNVPAGIISLLARAENRSTAIEVDLVADQVLEQDLFIDIRPFFEYASIHGIVTRDDPAAPGDTSRDVPVAGAMIAIEGLPLTVAAVDGTFAINDLPLQFSRVHAQVYDPETGRRGWFELPTLTADTIAHFPMRLSTTAYGEGTFRVRVFNARGEPVPNFDVISTGYPPADYSEVTPGVYERSGVPAPGTDGVVALAKSAGQGYGEQFATGKVHVDFDGHVGTTDLRLPGAGTITVALAVDQPCDSPPCSQAIGPVALTYVRYNKTLDMTEVHTITVEPDPVTGIVTFEKVPARQNVTVATVRHPLGYASEEVYLSHDGDSRSITLLLEMFGEVTGRVFAFDGITPVAGAHVRLETDVLRFSTQVTTPDGSFRFPAVPANTQFRVIAESTQDTIFRTALAEGTSESGEPVDLRLVMREQSTVEGRIVDVDGAIVPLARFWAKELAWPHREFGTAIDPLQADIQGRFVLTNVFTGSFRVTAVAPDNQELRGDYLGVLLEEGDASQRSIELVIGGAGTGSVAITIVDPLLAFERVENAEVTLMRGLRAFDIASSNANGVAYFEDVPAGTYWVTAFSKARVRGGKTETFEVLRDVTSSDVVQLDFRGAVSGYITDPDSDPPGARVAGVPVTLRGTLRPSVMFEMRDSTDANGDFEIIGVPEGPFTLWGMQIGTERVAEGPAGRVISELIPEHRDLHLELEKLANLTVKVYLPNDSGGPGELAPLAEVFVCQCKSAWGNNNYDRSDQGNPVRFERLLHPRGYEIRVTELGGEHRKTTLKGVFPPGVYEHEQIVVLPQTGTVEVTAVDNAGAPVADAFVRIAGGNHLFTGFTGPDGRISGAGFPLGEVGASATKGSVSASASGEVLSRSEPLRLTLSLGGNISVTGFVDAEAPSGTPSAGTRVLLSSRTSSGARVFLQTFTEDDGSYQFGGIVVSGTVLGMTYYAPDGVAVGARQNIAIPDATTGTFELPRVRLDGTPPRVLAIDPPVNSTNVSPATHVTITFNEQIAAAHLTGAHFQLIATNDGSLVNATIQPSVRPDGTFTVKLIPPAPPAGQQFPLRSNVLYRVVIASGIRDLTGNAVAGTIGTTFTTVDYAEPAIVRVEPAESEPLVEGQTFRVKFNRAVDLASFEPGNGGIVTLDRLDAHRGTVVQALPVATLLDPVDPSTLLVSPSGVAIAESSFYRLTIAGVRDTSTPANIQRGTFTAEYFSFDRVIPNVTIVSPVADGESLVAGVLYTVTAEVTDPDGDPAGDAAYLDWLDGAGASIGRDTSAPFTYSFVAPSAGSGATFTLQASATDLSFNTSEVVAKTWNVVPNEAPAAIVVTNTPESAYPTTQIATEVAFQDEGLAVTIALELRGLALDGSAFQQILASRTVTRTSTAIAFEPAQFTWTLPLALQDGTATVVATATDAVNNSATAEAAITVLTDSSAPEILSFAPEAESRFQFGVNGTMELEVAARDSETGIARVRFMVGGTTALDTASGEHDTETGVTTFRHQYAVPPKNADTRATVTVVVTDGRGNETSESHEVVFERVDDATIPAAAWITPLDGAALPANLAGWTTTLRLRASDDVKVTAVRFESDVLAAPITLTDPVSGTTDVYEASALLTMPVGRESFVIRAIVSDGDPAHDVVMPITIDPVDVAAEINGAINISSISAAQYEDKSVVVRGATVYVSVPLRLKDLIVIDGGSLSNVEGTPLALEITDRLFIDADSHVDFTGKGHLGGLRTREDNTLTNTSRSGMTLGDAANGAVNASASHAGIGGSWYGATNATYGSFEDPSESGAGGGAEPAGSGNKAGANGGGVVRIHGGVGLSRLVIAGSVRADGETRRSTLWGGGAGGSIDLRGAMIVTGAATRITANGSDGPGSAEVDSGGGGGRIAIHASDRFDLHDAMSTVQARGGRNDYAAEGATYVDGGAGTIYLLHPGASAGELIASSFDERHQGTTHRTAGTLLDADESVSAITIGPRTLARFDIEPSVVPVVDPTADVAGPDDLPTVTLTSTEPVAGTSIPRDTSVAAIVDAASVFGIREIRTIFDAQPADVVSYPTFAASIADAASTTDVDAIAGLGAATLKVRVTDRAGRSVESAVVTFDVIENTPPVIDRFETTPETESHAGRSIMVVAEALDDVAVTSLTLTSSVGIVTAQPATAPTAQSLAREFAVAIPPDVIAGTEILLTLSASDGYPARSATSATKTLTVLADAAAPALTIVSPTEGAELQEGSGATFIVTADVVDAEVAVAQVTATFEGVDYPLSFISGNRFEATLPVPEVEGSEPVAKQLTITAADYAGNSVAATVGVQVLPLIDPDAPALEWVCMSPGAMSPADREVAIRVSAVPSSGTNGVSTVTISVPEGAPLAAAIVGANLYEVRYTIPPATVEGTEIPIRVVARSVGGNESILLGTIEVIAGLEIHTASVIAVDDVAFEGMSLIVGSGGVLTIEGPHTFGNLVVLDGGKVIQQHRDLAAGDLVTVNGLYVGCGSSIDVSGLGYEANVAAPGAGVPDSWSAGSHIGRGRPAARSAGGTFGSVARPHQAGGGGQGDTAYLLQKAGGGVVWVESQSTIAIDGAVRANGKGHYSGGAGGGGSIHLIAAERLGGSGIIEANGGDNAPSGGGGGAIAIEYGTASGPLLTNIDARGGRSNPIYHGGAGSILLRGPTSTFGDLRIDNATLISKFALTELPAFGAHRAAMAGADTVTLAGTSWIAPAFVGHHVRITATDGTVRGTYEIAAIENDEALQLLNGFYGVATQDAVPYEGYIVYSPSGIGGRSMVAARWANDRWEYDNDTTFTAFNPRPDEVIIAGFQKDATRITNLETYSCEGGCATLHGIPLVELVAGEIVPNAVRAGTARFPEDLGVYDAAEIFLRPDAHGRSLILAREPTSVLTLRAGDGASVDVAPGDLLQGVYRFDSITLTDATVTTMDIIESGSAPVLVGTSVLSSGNSDLPLIGSTPGYEHGFYGAVVVGSAGAVTDSDGLLDMVGRNAARAAVSGRIVLEKNQNLFIGTRGDFSISRRANGTGGNSGVSALVPIVDSGYLSFMASRTNAQMQVGLAPADTTLSVNEPGHYGFRLLTNATYQIFANGVYANRNGSYSVETHFRIEKHGSRIVYFVDGVQVHEATTTAPHLRLDLGMPGSDTAEIHSIEYSTDSPAIETFRGSVEPDGSFAIPVLGRPGDVIEVAARDRHRDILESPPITFVFPDDVGVESLTLEETELNGGRSTTATVTLLAPAGADGAYVELSSDDAHVTLPQSIVIAAGTRTGTATAATTHVETPTDINLTATYGGTGTTTVLRVLPDIAPPVVTITAPAPGTHFREADATPITFTVEAIDADSGVASVLLTFDGNDYPMVLAGGVYSVDVPAPFVDGSTDVSLGFVITAEDVAGNVGTASSAIVVEPIVDARPPSIAISCGSDGAMYPAGSTATLRFLARGPDAINPLEKVEVTITDPDGVSTTYSAAPVSGVTDAWDVVYAAPALAADVVFTYMAVATSASATTASVSATFEVLADPTVLAANATIDATNMSFEGRTLVVPAGITVTIGGSHTFERLAVFGKVTSPAEVPIAVEGRTFVACGGSIDVTGRGYAPQATYPGARVLPVFTEGASHIGRGSRLTESEATYGSVRRPAEAGAGSWSRPGGGVIQLTGTIATIDGLLRANGSPQRNSDAGAGGSIAIITGKVSGGGMLEADGGEACRRGGGGAVAIEYSDAASVIPRMFARSGDSWCSDPAGAGTAFVRGPGTTYGSLTIDSQGLEAGIVELPWLGGGYALPGSSGNVLLIDRVDVPAYFVGHSVAIEDAAGAAKGMWRIEAINANELQLESGASIEPGDQWRGTYYFDVLTVRGAHVESGDRIEAGTPDIDGGSTIKFNDGPPELTAVLTLTNEPAGVFVTGAPGSVVDAESVMIAARNDRTGEVFVDSVNADGSVRVAVGGETGDTFTFVATDEHRYALASRTIAVAGEIEDVNSVSSLVLETAVVGAGETAQAMLRLHYPAKLGGVVVALDSSNHASVAVPPTVTIPPGSAGTAILIATDPTAAGEATITATYNGSVSSTLTIIATSSSLSSIAIEPSSVEGGAAANGTVVLGAPAPPGGADVILASSDASVATVAGTVNVPEGDTAASFTVVTAPVNVARQVSISGAWGMTHSAELEITACSSSLPPVPPDTSALPSTVWFDDEVPAGATVTGTATFDTSIAASGTSSLHFAAAEGRRDWNVTRAGPLAASTADYLEFWMRVNPCDPPREVAVRWGNGGFGILASWGENVMRLDLAGVRQMAEAFPADGEWHLFSVPVKAFASSAPIFDTLTISVHGGEAWFDAVGKSSCDVGTPDAPHRQANEFVWFDDLPPAGGQFSVGGEDAQTVAWNSDPSQAVIGNESHYMIPKTGIHQHVMSGATETLAVASDDVLFTYVMIDPCNPPRQIMLQFHDGTSWDHRASWGEDSIGGVFANKTTVIGPLPEPGRWTRLEVPASLVSLDGREVQGVGFRLLDGAAWFDGVGKIPRVNLALGKPARQSSTATDAGSAYEASHAVDGNTAGDHPSAPIAQTTSTSQPWWEVDLGAVLPIETIEVSGRTDCCATQLTNYWVFLSDVPITGTTVAEARAQNGVRAFRHRAATTTTAPIEVRRNGRYVRVQLEGQNALSLAEVQVFAPVTAGRMNLAAGSTGVSQTSSQGTRSAEAAVDGNSSGDDADGALSLTALARDPWWEIDLGAVQSISTIDVLNWTSCCTPTTNVFVMVSDVPFASKVLSEVGAQSGVKFCYHDSPARAILTFDVLRTGRYVRVQRPGNTYVRMSEIRIWSANEQVRAYSRPVDPDGSGGDR